MNTSFNYILNLKYLIKFNRIKQTTILLPNGVAMYAPIEPAKSPDINVCICNACVCVWCVYEWMDGWIDDWMNE